MEAEQCPEDRLGLVLQVFCRRERVIVFVESASRLFHLLCCCIYYQLLLLTSSFGSSHSLGRKTGSNGGGGVHSFP